MEDIIKQIRFKIIDNGFMSKTSISRELRTLGVEEEKMKEVFAELKNEPNIHKMEYTNRFVAKYRVRDLYYYNPNKRKRKAKKT